MRFTNQVTIAGATTSSQPALTFTGAYAAAGSFSANWGIGIDTPSGTQRMVINGPGAGIVTAINGTVNNTLDDGNGNASFRNALTGFSLTSSSGPVGGSGTALNLRPSGSGSANGQLAGSSSGAWTTYSGAGAARNVLDDGSGNLTAAAYVSSNSGNFVNTNGTGIYLRPSGASSNNGLLNVSTVGAVTVYSGSGAIRNTLDDGSGNATFAGKVTATGALVNTTGNGSAAQALGLTDTGGAGSKWLRVDTSGNFQIVNSAFTTGVLTVGDTGGVTHAGSLSAEAAQFTAMGAPAPTVTPTGTTGTTSYTYYVVARDTLGNAVSSVAVTTTTGNATLSGTNYNRITWAAVPGASTYDVLRGSQATSVATGLGAATLAFNDTGGATSAYTLAGYNVLQLKNNGGSTVFYVDTGGTTSATGNLYAGGTIRPGAGLIIGNGSYSFIPTSGYSGMASDNNGVLYVGANGGGIYLRPSGVTSNAGAFSIGTNGSVNTFNSSGSIRNYLDDGSGNMSATGAVQAAKSGIGRYVGTTSGPPTSGTYNTGDFANDPTHGLFYQCTSGGSPGTWAPLGSMPVVSLVGSYTTVTSMVGGQNLGSQLSFTALRTNPYLRVKLRADIQGTATGWGAAGIYCQINGSNAFPSLLILPTIADNGNAFRGFPYEEFGSQITATAGSTITFQLVMYRFSTSGTVQVNGAEYQVEQT